MPLTVQPGEHPAALPTQRLSLDLDLRKQLPGFLLQIRYQGAQSPIGLLGASGSGKTMTLRLLSGVTAAEEGHIVLNGRTLYDSARSIHLSPAERKIGVVFQDYALFPHLTVAENIGFGLASLPVEERNAEVNHQLRAMQLEAFADHYPAQLSGGQRQRTAIARAMAIHPQALLLDEPFSALDPHLRRQMEEHLRATLAGYNGAVLFVTHDMEEAFRFCSQLVVLDRGSIAVSGPRQQLFDHPGKLVAARLTGCKNISPAERIAEDSIRVPGWGCELQVVPSPSKSVAFVGIRSHQIEFPESPLGEGNTFPCWPVATSEAPHEMTVYLHLHTEPAPGAAAHLQADLPKHAWQALQSRPLPWKVKLSPERLLLLEP